MERDRRAAGAAVEAAAGEKGWNVSDLASAAGVDYGTAADFVAGRRWPQNKTRASIEKALGWPTGTINRIANGGAPRVASSSAHDAPRGPGYMPSISELLTAHRDRTNWSYERMAKSVEGISGPQLHTLANYGPENFPYPKAVQAIADLLQVPSTTVLAAFAVSLGLPVKAEGSHLAISLPPGSDILEPGDVEAVRAVVRQLVHARQAAAPPDPDPSAVGGVRLYEPDPVVRDATDAPRNGSGA